MENWTILRKTDFDLERSIVILVPGDILYMQFSICSIDCEESSVPNSMGREYQIGKVIYDTEEDDDVLRGIFEEGIERSQSVNETTANDSLTDREQKRLKIDGVSGVLAEYSWKIFLNNIQEEFCDFTEFEDASTDKDLEIQDTGEVIEVRSSNVENGVEFGLCSEEYQFQVVGPYANEVKPGEPEKDYYVMVLYPVEKQRFFDDYFSSEFDRIEVHLTCGATWDMMMCDEFSEEKPLSGYGNNPTVRSRYRVVPFGNSKDTEEIIRTMMGQE